MPQVWKPVFLCGLMGVMMGASGWGEHPGSVPPEEREEDVIVQDLEIVRELEMLQVLEMLREMDMLGEMDQLLPPESEGGEENR